MAPVSGSHRIEPNHPLAMRVLVRRSRSSQTQLRRHPEHISASPALLMGLGSKVGEQVRIVRNHELLGLYTISEAVKDDPPDVMRMGPAARARLDAPDEFAATATRTAADPVATDTDAESRGELVERLYRGSGRRGLVAIAPHGGAIEVHTDDQAERVAEVLGAMVSCWRCKGWGGGNGAMARWHITSTDISAASFPLLALIANRPFARAVSFHGFHAAPGSPDVLVGGAASLRIKSGVREEIERAVAGTGLLVRIAEAGDPLGGSEPTNLVNRLTRNGHNGIQIEQSLQARTGHWSEIATAVAIALRPNSNVQPLQPIA
jgi:phage replication-related protein YjqB (UPF0714/DUF867 family)